MVKGTSAHPGKLPFKDPEEKSAVKPDYGIGNTFESASDPALQVVSEAGVITPVSNQDVINKQDEPSDALLFDYFQQGMESLQGLGFDGIK
ncbi:MAG: hypothetical protein QNK79_01295 [Synechococcus sp. ArSW.bin.68]